MEPAYLEKLDFMPMTSSHKADRKALPAPKGPRLAVASGRFVAPRSEAEQTLAQSLIEVMKIERASVDDHFFQDLGGHSLLMARFCSEIRKRMNVSVSMRDIYLNPTIAKLAEHLKSATPEATVEAPREPLHIASNLAYYGCGALQALSYASYGVVWLWLMTKGFEWSYAAIDNVAVAYLRVVAFSVGIFVLLSAIPVATKWLLIGRWKEEVIPVWSLRYFRFWLVKALIRSAPVTLLTGSPLYNVYLRLLGARIGRRSVIEATLVPVCTDLISIGDDTIIRRNSTLLGYRAQSNNIHTGSISVGNNVFVGEASVLDINTTIEDGAQLGHVSSLQVGQRVPKGKRYHGSPAQQTSANYCTVEARPCSSLRRWFYSGVELGLDLAVLLPLVVLALYYALPMVYDAAGAAEIEHAAPAL